MLIIPFDQKINWHNPPLVTLLLVIVNSFIFFGLQSGRGESRMAAYDYYLKSNLPQIEFPAYQRYLEENDSEQPFAGENIVGLFQMESDTDFQQALQKEQIITRKHLKYGMWVRQRSYFDALQKEDFTEKYSLRTAEPTVITLFSHMFLHGDFMHLLGNMIFLIAVGFLVEATLGKVAYLGCYLLAGLGSGLFYTALTEPSMIISLGASGAIAGLMGMYAVLYWIRPIRFFYFLFVYFDYITLPAIILLPIWIGAEILKMVLYPNSNINYLAHLGGLLSGGLLGLVAKFWIRSHDMSFYDEAQEKKQFQVRLDEASRHCRSMDFKKALPVLKQLNREKEAHPEVLYRLQQCTRLEPDSEEFHHWSKAFFVLPEHGDPRMVQWTQECFQYYLKNAKPKPKLAGALITNLCDRFLRAGDLENAEFLVNILLRQTKNDVKTLDLLERLIILLTKKGHSKKSQFFATKLQQLKNSCA